MEEEEEEEEEVLLTERAHDTYNSLALALILHGYYPRDR